MLNTTARTIKMCDGDIYSFWNASIMHSDQGPSLVSQELRVFISGKGVAMTPTTAYNPTCNGQVEK